jgi:hypothetical protein
VASEPAGGRTPAPALRLQIALLALLAFVPIAWLIGRRTAPPPRPQPLIVDPAEAAVALQEGRGGVASSLGAVTLPPPSARQGAYRLVFVPVAPGQAARPPFDVRLQGPDGRDLWVGLVREAGAHRTALELAVPAALLSPGRHVLLVRDAGGYVRHYPFIVP